VLPSEGSKSRLGLCKQEPAMRSVISLILIALILPVTGAGQGLSDPLRERAPHRHHLMAQNSDAERRAAEDKKRDCERQKSETIAKCISGNFV
jgi:hypothetical protein